jgi:cell division septum initiation protein DivIVA
MMHIAKAYELEGIPDNAFAGDYEELIRENAKLKQENEKLKASLRHMERLGAKYGQAVLYLLDRATAKRRPA